MQVYKISANKIVSETTLTSRTSHAVDIVWISQQYVDAFMVKDRNLRPSYQYRPGFMSCPLKLFIISSLMQFRQDCFPSSFSFFANYALRTKCDRENLYFLQFFFFLPTCLGSQLILFVEYKHVCNSSAIIIYYTLEKFTLHLLSPLLFTNNEFYLNIVTCSTFSQHSK